MSDFNTVNCQQSALDPQKRVCYSMGMVLGVDEFQQEQAHFLNRDRLHNRMQHGYGVVNGLGVEVKIEDGQPVVVVHPGMAVDPQGQHICVPSMQCGQLNDWLARHRDDVLAVIGSPPDRVSLFVLLCYHECKTDRVPVPGGPCRSEDDATAASRVAETFELRLSLKRPAQAEEKAVRRLGDWLRRIEIGTQNPLTVAEAIQSFRDWLKEQLSLSPPAAPVRLHPADVEEVVQSVLGIWTRELRPELVANCAKVAKDAECVLLAELTFDVEQNGGGVQVASLGSPPDEPVQVSHADQTSLLSTRVLQELNLLGFEFAWQGLASGDLDGNYPDPNVVGLRGNPIGIAPPQNNDVLIWDGAAWIPQNPAAALPPASGDVSGTYPNLTVVRLQNQPVRAAPPPQQDQVLTWDGSQWVPQGPTAGPLPPASGDVSGTYPNLTVVRLQNQPVRAAPPPQQDQVLTWDGSQWVPQGPTAGPLPPATGDVSGTYPNLTVVRLQNQPVRAAPPPQQDQVLTWDGTQWLPRTLPPLPQPQGNFVMAPYPSNGRYAVIGAGHFVTDGRQIRRVGPAYGGLEVDIVGAPTQSAFLLRLMNGSGQRRYVPPPLDNQFHYVVKGIVHPLQEDIDNAVRVATGPVVNMLSQAPRMELQLVGFHKTGIVLRVNRQSNSRPTLGFMVEISVFGRSVPASLLRDT